MKIARTLIAAAAIVAGAALPAQTALAAPAHDSAGQRSTHASFKLPYKDPNQAGWLTLCGTNLKPVTQGSIKTWPFVWRVVSDVRTPAAYWIKGAKSAFTIYQPRPYTPAGDWSGVLMAASSLYTNRDHPMAQFTPIDEPLTYMTAQYKPIWDHLLELRLYLGAPDRPEYIDNYAAADIQVIGNTWHLVAGGNGSCTDGKVVSEEVLYGLKGAAGKPKSAGAAKAGTGSPSANSGKASTSGSGSGGSGSGGSGTGSVDAADATHTSSAGPLVAALAGAALIVIALVASAAVWRRRRRVIG